MGFGNVWIFICTEKNQTGYVVSTGSCQTLQQAPKIAESAETMKNQATKPILVYLLLLYLLFFLWLPLMPACIKMH